MHSRIEMLLAHLSVFPIFIENKFIPNKAVLCNSKVFRDINFQIKTGIMYIFVK